MEHIPYKHIIFSLLCATCPAIVFSQEKVKKDSVKVETQRHDNTMMLNASSSTGPRTVNIGLPEGVGGTVVLENNLPVVYISWPVLPTRVWRLDATIVGFDRLNLNQTALKTGNVGISVGTRTNLGTDFIMGAAQLESNHFGLWKGTLNFSAPINDKGLSFSVGGYINLNPGTFDVPFKKYYSDNTKIFNGALTQKYNEGKDRISFSYKYIDTQALYGGPNLFQYEGNGKIQELEGIKIGESSYYESTGILWFKDPYNGILTKKKVFDDYFARSHQFDIIGHNSLSNNWNLDYTLRYTYTRTALYYFSYLGTTTTSGWQKLDGSPYTGDAELNIAIATPEMTLNTLSGIANFNKKTKNHNYTLGMIEQFYDPGTYVTSRTFYYTDLQNNPNIVAYAPGNTASPFDEHGNIKSMYNSGSELYSGKENKLTAYISDEWNIAPKLQLNYGARLEWQKNKGYYAPSMDEEGNALAYTARKSDGTFSNDRSLYYDIDKNYLNMVFYTNFIYKTTPNFGFLLDASYNRQSPKLESYAGAYQVDPKQSNTPYGSFGLYYNHLRGVISLVSKATYIKKDHYVSRIDFKNESNNSVNKVVTYDIETLGWTTDVLFDPFKNFHTNLKNFSLHFLITIQSPKYKNYKGSTGLIAPDKYDFNDKVTTTVSKLLLEIDPSYTHVFKDKNKTSIRFWISARYYSKQYANLSNTIFYEPHWETFGGITVNYKKFEFYTNIVNILNQRGVNGTIGGSDLYSQQYVNDNIVGSIQAASYIRPFTVEFGMKYRFTKLAKKD